VQRTLTNPRYEEFSGLRDVVKCECIYNPALATPGHGRVQPCKTSNEESASKTSGLPQKSESKS